jgi:hypothetical protein
VISLEGDDSPLILSIADPWQGNARHAPCVICTMTRRLPSPARRTSVAIPKQTVVEEARDDKRKREREDARKRKLEQSLDSFPASDPVNVTQPAPTRRNNDRRRK